MNNEPEIDVLEAVPFRGFEIVRHRITSPGDCPERFPDGQPTTPSMADLACSRWLIVDPANRIASTPAASETDARQIIDERLGPNDA